MLNMVKIEKLSLVIKTNEILSDVNLKALSGNITGLVGDNGSGKTMIMKCICGFITTYTGDIMIDEKNIKDTGVDKFNMGILIESPGFISYYSGFKNLKCLADIKNIISNQKIQETMKLVGLDHKKRIKVSEYSLGMKQRLGLAQSIMEDPDILILDEPFNGLDNKMSNKIRQMLIEMKQQGKTIILSSHNQNDIDILCDAVYRIESGKCQKIT